MFQLYVHNRVLVMDLCTGGSLFNILDDPENAYGLDETEFIYVVRDVGQSSLMLVLHSLCNADVYIKCKCLCCYAC